MVLSYLAGLNVITIVLIRGGQEGQSQRGGRLEDFILLALKMEDESMS